MTNGSEAALAGKMKAGAGAAVSLEMWLLLSLGNTEEVKRRRGWDF